MADDDLFVTHNQASGATRSVERVAALRSLPADAVDTNAIEDGAVTAPKLDASAIGQGFLEIGRTTLGSAGDLISVTGLPARKYLRIFITTINSGSITYVLRFNNDSGNNYARRISSNGGADATGTGQSAALTMSGRGFTVIKVFNEAASEKLCIASSTLQSTAGAGTAPNRAEYAGKWANTSDQITRVDVVNTDSGDFASGSEVVVLGKN